MSHAIVSYEFTHPVRLISIQYAQGVDQGMWTDGVLHLPDSLWTAYETVLTRYGLLEKCKSHSHGRGQIGGFGRDEALGHFTYRFANSASRICYLVEDPQTNCGNISGEFKTSFFEGKIHLLDLVGGTGAGASGLLCAIASMRAQSQLPMLPLNVHITAADISPHALQIYNEMIDAVRPALMSAGILVQITVVEWNAVDVSSTSALCDSYLLSAGNEELFVLVSALSGIGNKDFETLSRSFNHVSERISNAPATFAWIEPHGSSGLEFLRRAVSKIFDISHWFTNKTPETVRVAFSWFHRIQTEPKIISGGLSIKMYKRYGI